MIFFYQFLGFLLIPIIKINIQIRLLKGKEDKIRYLERYGISKINRPQGKVIWIHAASIGEFKSSSILINKLHSNFNILVTTTTLSAANYAIENYGNKIIKFAFLLAMSLYFFLLLSLLNSLSSLNSDYHNNPSNT